MKKTLITLLALGGAAVAGTVTPDTVILGQTGTENPWGNTGVYATHANGAPNAPTANAVIVSGAFANGITYEMKHSAGRTWIIEIEDTWTNTAALDIYNAATGYNLTSTQLNSGTLSASAAGSSYETFTLDFSGYDGSQGDIYSINKPITIYAFVSWSPSDNQATGYGSMTVTGINNAEISYASDTGSGFDGVISGKGELTLVRIEGTLAGDVVTLKGGGNKTGFHAVTVIPEPATATLSLLALAGLAARRRRK